MLLPCPQGEKKMEDSLFSSISFFGKIDHTRDGRISSEMPAWAHDKHVEDLKESIAHKEREISLGIIPPTELYQMQTTLRAEKTRLEEIESSRPKLSSVQENAVLKSYKDLKDKISDSLYTRSEEQAGLADPREEAKRMTMPCIAVDPELARACGVSHITSDAKVSRNDAAKIFKIVSRYFGEPSNVEYLRKDKRR